MRMLLNRRLAVSSKLGLIILCLLVVVSPAIFSPGDHAVFAQRVPSDAEGTGQGVKTIHSISVQKGSDSLTVEVQADGTCAFKQYEFKNPSRLVIDIYGAI